jgi:hypothetical protein
MARIENRQIRPVSAFHPSAEQGPHSGGVRKNAMAKKRFAMGSCFASRLLLLWFGIRARFKRCPLVDERQKETPTLPTMDGFDPENITGWCV